MLGLSQLLMPEQVTIVANTGDDFEHLGLRICPDVDTLLYTLADWNNKEVGWGQREESWNFLTALKRLGGEDWFLLGDRDMATHIARTERLRRGETLSEVVAFLCQKMQIAHRVVPMTDDPVSTVVRVQGSGSLTFQHYFVRERCEPPVESFEFQGIAAARPSPAFQAALEGDVSAVLICPSNPFVSVDPILALPGVVERIRARRVPVVVVSNIVGGQAIKGPAAKMMAELGMPQTALAVASYYREKYGDLIRGFVLDETDAALKPEVEALGLAVALAPSVMTTLEDKVELAARLLDFVAELDA